MTIWHYIVCANGIYDIICAYCILFEPNTYFAKIHMSIFTDASVSSPITSRLLAYWLYTYGFIRIGIMYPDTRLIVASTYFIEAGAYANESLVYDSTYTYKSAWVAITSVILGYMIL